MNGKGETEKEVKERERGEVEIARKFCVKR